MDGQVSKVLLLYVRVMVSLDDAKAQEGLGIGSVVEASCAHLSLLILMLVNAGLFPFGVTGMGICDMNEGCLDV